MAKKMTRIVAVASGIIGWILDERGGECAPSLSIMTTGGGHCTST